MSILRRAIASFAVTMLLVIVVLGFWVTDYNSRKIAFDDATFTRFDVTLNKDEWNVIVGKRRFRLIFSEPLKSTGHLLFLLLPPDISLLLNTFDTLTNTNSSPTA